MSPQRLSRSERARERERKSLRIMERQLASGFCSAIEAITLHYADSRVGEGSSSMWGGGSSRTAWQNISIWIEQQLSRQRQRRRREGLKYENQTGFLTVFTRDYTQRGERGDRPRLNSQLSVASALLHSPASPPPPLPYHSWPNVKAF